MGISLPRETTWREPPGCPTRAPQPVPAAPPHMRPWDTPSCAWRTASSPVKARPFSTWKWRGQVGEVCVTDHFPKRQHQRHLHPSCFPNPLLRPIKRQSLAPLQVALTCNGGINDTRGLLWWVLRGPVASSSGAQTPAFGALSCHTRRTSFSEATMLQRSPATWRCSD